VSRPVWLLAAGWLLLALGWAIGNPQFAAPDEADHYVRAAALSAGTVVGAEAPDYMAPVPLPEQAAWMEQTARRVSVPAGLAPPATCYVTNPRQSAACIDDQPVPPEVVTVTPVGTYQPLPYLLPAAALTFADDPAAGDRLARLAGLLPALALLIGAVLAVGVLGPLVAVTPMVVYSAATLNGSGLEIAAGLAFAAAVLRATRPGEATPRPIWALAAVAGAALALSRSTGPAWVLAIAALGLARCWAVRGSYGPGNRPGRAGWIGAAVVAAAVAANRVWEHTYGADATLSLIDPRGAARVGFEAWGGAVGQLVGGFGYLEADIPLPLALLWAAITAALLITAARAATTRERLVLAAALTAAVLGPVALYAILIRHTGFGLQGRHVLPALVAIPLLAAELARRRRSTLLLPAAGATAAVVHLGAWWAYAHRSAVGTDGPFFFIPDAEWTPPGGYALWIAMVVAGAALTAAAAWAARNETG
jgi:hypothetical protein